MTILVKLTAFCFTILLVALIAFVVGNLIGPPPYVTLNETHPTQHTTTITHGH